jgi:uncharacterized protein (DUF2141 family)
MTTLEGKEKLMKMNILLPLVAAVLYPVIADAGTLHLKIEGFTSDQGMARVVVMRGAKQYDGNEPVAQVVIVPIFNQIATWRSDLAKGDYALIAHHDRDGDDSLNRPVLGLPLESYGYSNGVWTSFGLPRYEEVSFRIEDEDALQTIRVRRNVFAVIGEVALIALTALLALVLAVRFLAKRRISRFSVQSCKRDMP